MIRPFESQEIFDEANDEIEDPLLANENTHHSGERKKKKSALRARDNGTRGEKRKKEGVREREMARGEEEEQSGHGNGVRVRKGEKAMGTKREKGRLIDARSLIFATCTK